MSAKYTININNILSGTTGLTINVPINLKFEPVDNSDLIETVFVDKQTALAINPILDYEKSRFLPISGVTILTDVIYNVNLLVNGTIKIPTYYSDAEMTTSDISFRRNYFTQSYLYLNFYDSDSALTQNLVSDLTIYSFLTNNDLLGGGSVYGISGQVKPATQIPLSFTLSSPEMAPNGFSEGYYLYDYKDEYVAGLPNYLYMRASYNNAKNGKSTNLMTEPISYPIDELVNKLYTRYKLYRNNISYYYEIDTTYSNNVALSGSQVTVNLYQIQVS